MIYCQWEFEGSPVSLCQTAGHPQGWRLPETPWNPWDNAGDLLPVLTTAYPAINSCHNVMPSTFATLREEWGRGHQVCVALVGAVQNKWETLWNTRDFFAQYPKYIMISASAPTAKELTGYAGLVQSSIRLFAQRIPPHDAHGVPFPKEFSVPRDTTTEDDGAGGGTKAWFVGVKVLEREDGGKSRNLELTPAFNGFVQNVERKMMGGTYDPERCKLGQVQIFGRSKVPLFVFPDGVRPKKQKQPKKSKGEVKAVAKPNVKQESNAPGTNSAPTALSSDKDLTATSRSDGTTKRKADPEETEVDDHESKRPAPEVRSVIDDELELESRTPAAPKQVASLGAPKLRLTSTPRV